MLTVIVAWTLLGLSAAFSPRKTATPKFFVCEDPIHAVAASKTKKSRRGGTRRLGKTQFP